MSPPADDLVVLLDHDGRPVGTAARLEVHHADTPLHLAFSLHLIDEHGRTLITRRALAKRTWPGVWTNSCCGHPRPGESVLDAVRRRVGEELGVHLAEDPGTVSTVLPDFRYRAVDASGVVEHEICPVHVSAVSADLRIVPDPAEVAQHAWVGWADLHEAVVHTPVVFSPWLVEQVLALGPEVPSPAVRCSPAPAAPAAPAPPDPPDPWRNR